MKDFIVNVSAKTSKVYLEQTSIAVDGENIAGKIIFKFDGNNFIDGVARLEWQNGSDKYFQLMEKVDKTYVLPIKNAMTKEGKMYFQLVITQAEVDEEIPIFKSNQFYVFVEKSINAECEAPDEYATWLDTANEKILEMTNLNITATKSGNTETITLTDKDGVEHTTYIYDGEAGSEGPAGPAGPAGQDAKINGVNTLNILAGQNITLNQEGNNLTINSQGGGSGSGNVDDVKVNGTSVVENKIANIDLTGKQDTLVSGTNIKTINNQSILGSGDITTNSKYYVSGNSLVYNVSIGSYAVIPNTTSTITKTKLSNSEIAEAISLAYANDKYLILNIYTTQLEAEVQYHFASKFVAAANSQNVGTSNYTNPSSGNVWSAQMTINYSYVLENFTVNSINVKGDAQKSIGTYNGNAFTPTSDYHPATKKYVDDNIVNMQYSTMPTASANNVGQIVQYVGTTSGLYVNGFLYKCVEYTSGSYRWEYINEEYEFEPTARVSNLRQDTAFQENIRKMLLMNKQSAVFPINLTSGDNNGHNGIQVVRIAQNIKNHPATINIYTTTIAYYSFAHYGYTGWEQTNATVTWTDNNPTITNMTTASGSDTDNIILTTKNTQSFTPTANYHPATKKYVDDIVGDIESLLGGI